MKSHPIKAILFDLDDTLWPIAPVIAQAEHVLYEWLREHVPALTSQFSNEQLRALRSEILPSDTRYQFDLWALRHATLTKACLMSGADHTRMDEAMAVFSVARNAVTLFDDVLPGLARLSERFAIGSVSNGFADLQTIGIAHHFHTSIAAHSFGRAKPDPAIFHAACDAMGVTPQQTLYVGDDLVLDVQAAQAAGLEAVWMNRFRRTLPAGIVPDAICSSLQELDAWLTQRIAAGASE
jgi:FMN hydrolase / 5-amino-6-(5-phospho-D-ribitylamino)uracil phosphatase